MENTSLHYFCSLLIKDIEIRIAQDAATDKELKVANQLIKTIKEVQDFNGLDAPVEDEQSIVFDHRTLYQAIRPLAALVMVLLFPFFLMGQKITPPMDLAGDYSVVSGPAKISDKKAHTAYGTRKANEDTLSVKFTLDCTQGVIWTGYRVRRRISSTAVGFIYLGPDKKRIRKGCQISAIIP